MRIMQERPPVAPALVDERLWEGVDRVLDRAPQLADLRRHQLGPLAARRFRKLGRPVPEELLDEERFAAIVVLTAPVVLARVREAIAGPLLVMKGPAVAARYPDEALRPFKDLDLLVKDAEAAQRDLVAAGFHPVGDPALYDGIHHLRPLAFPWLPLTVEVHSAPKWIEGLPPPDPAELFAAADEEGLRIDGVLTLPAAHHAIVLAAHSWAHEPLRRLRDLVDVASMAQGLDREELARIATAWKIERAWATTIGAADELFLDGRSTWAVRLWGQNLRQARERTVLENHLVRWVGSFWALPAGDALRSLGGTLQSEVRPDAGESWKEKLQRSARAVRNAARRRSEHEDSLRRDAERERSDRTSA
jgi:hypothetical protein